MFSSIQAPSEQFCTSGAVKRCSMQWPVRHPEPKQVIDIKIQADPDEAKENRTSNDIIFRTE
jgi:hypothetical protein